MICQCCPAIRHGGHKQGTKRGRKQSTIELLQCMLVATTKSGQNNTQKRKRRGLSGFAKHKLCAKAKQSDLMMKRKPQAHLNMKLVVAVAEKCIDRAEEMQCLQAAEAASQKGLSFSCQDSPEDGKELLACPPTSPLDTTTF